MERLAYPLVLLTKVLICFAALHDLSCITELVGF
jgi:hypothetical protein